MSETPPELPPPAPVKGWEAGLKALLIVATLLGAGVLWYMNPTESPVPIKMCAMNETVGIPCPSCGMTRATHCVLRLDLSKAWYYNPMIFPLFIGWTVLMLVFTWEVATRKRSGFFRMIRGWESTIVLSFLGMFVLNWIVMIWLTLNGKRPELLNPDAPLIKYLQPEKFREPVDQPKSSSPEE